MKRTLLLFTLLALPTALIPQIDCLSKTKQLKEAYDHKSYGHVSCTCPCDQYRAKGLQSADRNKCLECLHFHDPRPFIFLSKASFKPAPLWEKWHKNPRLLMQRLIAHYRIKRGMNWQTA
jgi:hypothetical protein